MSNELILAFVSRLPEYILGIVNVVFIIQLRRLMLTNEAVKAKDEKILTLEQKLEEQRYNITMLEKHYAQLIQDYKSKTGELQVYQRLQGGTL